MTTLSDSQTQLLKILQITQLQVTNDLKTSGLSKHRVNFSKPDLTVKLAADISLLLTEKMSWLIAPDVAEPTFQHDQLVTPPLESLQQADQKKALWALLSSLDET